MIRFSLCPVCAEKYGALRFDPTCTEWLNTTPFCSLRWSDEDPKHQIAAMTFDESHKECRDSIIRLAGARTHLWRTGNIPEEFRELWEEARCVLLNWPGFQRLSLNRDQREALDDCEVELDELLGAIGDVFPNMTFVEKEGGLTEMIAQRENPSIRFRSPLRISEYSKGSDRAMAFGFDVENVDAFTREWPQGKVALIDWKSKNGSMATMIMFAVVSGPEHHAPIESAIQQICRDPELSPLLSSLEVRVAFYLDPEGEAVKDYVLEATAKSKAWWPFWRK